MSLPDTPNASQWCYDWPKAQPLGEDERESLTEVMLATFDKVKVGPNFRCRYRTPEGETDTSQYLTELCEELSDANPFVAKWHEALQQGVLRHGEDIVSH